LAEEIGTLDRLKKAELIRLREEVTLKLAVSTGAEHLRLLQTLQATEFLAKWRDIDPVKAGGRI
jgi:hypothetical protein